jgi:hypothetical protein
MKVKVTLNEAGKPAGKLADAEPIFEDNDGPLNGLKLVGFAVWQRRSGPDKRITFPARRYSLSGAQRSYALLRPTAGTGGRAAGEESVRALILHAFEEGQERVA